ncbi:hypothetical protein SEVIR_8G229700v4 [Setaria viridis]|uniref:CAND6/7 N-terminal domain-containing protein n=1 Tax=Setaria viridis TaxID=4556 RepID=A0A4V6D3E0_SETVI|nr:protein CANDIDATE G-PROTEIN COUPLED RECEPTOR 7-like [Setaria viridis]TKW02186.1 hypothetical protein SEVIR_8G229700v2 [Setaria viridis]
MSPCSWFSSSRHGWVSISVTGAKASSTHPEPDPSQLGFFLLSDEALFKAISLEPPLPMDLYRNPEWSSPSCVLYRAYIITLFTFAYLDDEGHFNWTFTVTHANEYSLFLGSCMLEAKVTMEVQTHIYNTNPNHSVGTASVRSSSYKTYHGQMQRKARRAYASGSKRTIFGSNNKTC